MKNATVKQIITLLMMTVGMVLILALMPEQKNSQPAQVSAASQLAQQLEK